MIKRLSAVSRLIFTVVFLAPQLFGASTPINISVPTTINAEGIYIVAAPIALPGIQVSAPAVNIDLNLNGYTVHGILIDSGLDTITIRNGTVVGASPALDVQGGTNIFIKDIIAKNAIGDVGIHFANVFGGAIINCSMTQNTTGLELEDCAKISIDNCVASCNTNAGYCLIRSITNCLRDCKALSTGEGNTQEQDVMIAGFISTDGYGNIFERCIANSTQALSTTDYNSLVAGFALRGSEGCSKIIECEAANATVNENGVTIPYGILLQGTLENPLTLTGVPPVPDGNFIREGGWHPSENYFAVSFSGSISVYAFDHVTRIASRIAQATTGSLVITELDWSPDGRFIAASGDQSFGTHVYEFYENEQTLLEVAQINSPTGSLSIREVQWHPQGRFIAVITDNGGGSGELFLYEFDTTASQLTQAISTIALDDEGAALDWHPNGNILVVGTEESVNPSLEFYSFDASVPSLAKTTGVDTGSGTGAVRWSPDGIHLATGDFGAPGSLRVFQVSEDLSSIIQKTFVNLASGAPGDMSWSPDGAFIATAFSGVAGVDLIVFSYDQDTVLQEAARPVFEVPPAEVGFVNWSPSGQYILAVTVNFDLKIYEAFVFPSKNVITGNTVYCNSGGRCPQGVGISGSSIQNLIMGNTAYSNPIPQTETEGGNPIVSSNYQFVTNVFNALFGNAPTDLQNISVDGCQPICMPDDLALIDKQILYKVCGFSSLVDVIQNDIGNVAASLSCGIVPMLELVSQSESILLSKLDLINASVACNIMPILDLVSESQEQLCSKIDLIQDTAAGVTGTAISNPCTPDVILASTDLTLPDMMYCVANAITDGPITISANNIVVDLNDYLIEDGIIIASGVQNITIQNGMVENNGLGNAILANSGAQNITIKNVCARNAEIGINFDGVVGGLIQYCEFTQNITGLELDNCAKITIDNCTADCNLNAGYCLLSSTTCCVINSKALSTGEGNAQTADALVAGFISSDGYGNIFERCIANSTQALFTTDYNSLVAGFALRGSEGCTKIIECESANATTSETGLTVPYGIFLESSLNIPITLTTRAIGSTVLDVPEGANWSPDGKYVVISDSGTSNVVIIYEFDYQARILQEVTTQTGPTVLSSPRSARWSPDGRHIATVDTAEDVVLVYEFDATARKLSEIASIAIVSPAASVDILAWSPDGRYIGALTTGGTPSLIVYEFNAVEGILIELVSIGGLVGPNSNSVDWRPDGRYISVTDSGGMRVYSFDPGSASLSLVASESNAAITADWSPNGKYLAVSDFPRLAIYEFDAGSASLVRRVQTNVGIIVVTTRWSPDGRYIACADTSSSVVRIFEFDPATVLLTQVATDSGGALSNPDSSDWSPDGSYITVVDSILNQVFVYQALSFVSKNVVSDNIVYCNSGGACPSGVGISGSSIQNMIIGNTCYSNPIPQMNIEGGGPIVSSNYEFVTNVFNPLFGQAPSDLQNISVDGCEPICMPEDLALLSKQILYKLGSSAIQSKIDQMQAQFICNPEPITASITLTTPDTIYCVANAITDGPIEVAANNISIDLNNFRIEDGIVITGAASQVSIKNGVVENNGSGKAIELQSGGQNITLENITACNAAIGIDCKGVQNCCIKNCEFTQNSTGLGLNGCSNIIIDTCIAQSNSDVGFNLISSFANCLRDCKAISTGDGNVQTVGAQIAGFMAKDGSANIFERCIANSTQALSLIDYDSLIAGFALRGTERCTKIIDCESANTQTNQAGVAVPYGILIEGRFEGLAQAEIESGVGDLLIFDWSPDGKYIAVLNEDNELKLYSVDNVYALALIESISLGISSRAMTANIDPAEINWSPDGRYLAVGTNVEATLKLFFQLYQFDSYTQKLTLVDSFEQTGQFGELGVTSVRWTADGTYLAMGIGKISSSDVLDELRIYKFDSTSQKITLVKSLTRGTTQGVRSLDWSCDGNYLAVSFLDTSGIQSVFVYSFDRSDNELLAVTPALSENVTELRWSSDGKFLAMVTKSPIELVVYAFDRSSESLIFKDRESLGGSSSQSYRFVSWSPDGRYIATRRTGVMDTLRVFEYDRHQEQLIALNDIDVDGIGLAWSPDGRFIVTGIDSGSSMALYTGLNFPSKNVITGNTVYCNSGGSCPSGVGISGSSIANMITNNTAYSNPIPQTETEGGGPIVSSNYYFVTNVFNQLFGQAPTALQNISLDGCTPICMPEDELLLAKQILYQLGKQGCDPTPITGPTTITESGPYCLANNIVSIVPAAINIAADDVVVDLNNYTIEVTTAGNTQGVLSSGDNVTVKNGTIKGISTAGTAGLVNAQSSSNFTMENVTIEGGDSGLLLVLVEGALIKNCTMKSAIDAGAKLILSDGVVVENSSVINCQKLGFNLQSSTNCCVRDCKAIGTGVGNTNTFDQTIVGFDAQSGTGNIFERCIANSTQALSTTDSQSLVAGFALRGSEQCTKIIECESANSTTSPAGVTVPYGILVEATVDNFSQFTSTTVSDPRSSTWSPDGAYVAVADPTVSRVVIYEFDRVAGTLVQVTTQSGSTALVTPFRSEWSPDGAYVAVADPGSNQVIIYEFDRGAGTLVEVATQSGPTALLNPFSSEWSPDGTYVAVAASSSNQVIIYEFDRVAGTLVEVATQSGPTTLVTPRTSEWSPDGTYVAVAASSSNQVIIYEFDRGAGTLVEVATQSGPTTLVTPFSLDWSSDGVYVAVADSGSNQVIIYEFDRGAGTLVEVATQSGPTTLVTPISLGWSPDGAYVAVADADTVIIYAFDRGAGTLIEVTTQSGSLTLMTPRSSEWGPDGAYVAVADSGIAKVVIYEALIFPSKNVITKNTLYCNSGGRYPSGVGISGSSIQNMIIGNTCYSNPIPQMIENGGPIVSSNYQFVTNVFNQLFGQAPTDLQNISLDGCDPICAVCDPCLLIKQNQAQINRIQSKLDVLLAAP